MQSDDQPDEMAMTRLHPNQTWVMRIRGMTTAVPLIAMIVVLDIGPIRETAIPAGLAPGAAAFVALLLLILLPPRRYRAWGFRESEDELQIRYGLWTRIRTVVPFGRVQHIDVAQGPVERQFGLATLILHTAGTRGAAVSLPGLPHEEAERMRDRIRAKIRQELA